MNPQDQNPNPMGTPPATDPMAQQAPAAGVPGAMPPLPTDPTVTPPAPAEPVAQVPETPVAPVAPPTGEAPVAGGMPGSDQGGQMPPTGTPAV